MKHALVFKFLISSLTFIFIESNIPSLSINSFISALFITFILLLLFALLISILSPFSDDDLLIIVTVLQISAKYKDSSKALFPAPTMETSSPLYKLPSHREQKLIPFPCNLSELLFSFLGLLPTAKIIFFAFINSLFLNFIILSSF